MSDQRQAIATALADFDSYPLPEAAVRLFGTMGYASNRTLPVNSVTEFCAAWDEQQVLTDREREALDQLSSLHLLFQLTDGELTMQRDLLDRGDPHHRGQDLSHTHKGTNA